MGGPHATLRATPTMPPVLIRGTTPDALEGCDRQDERMQTTVHEIAEGVFRLSTCVADVAPDGFTFNQFLIDADEPLLFHCGPRAMFPLVAEAAAKVLPIERIRWITFGHVEADECGSMNQWLA